MKCLPTRVLATMAAVTLLSAGPGQTVPAAADTADTTDPYFVAVVSGLETGDWTEYVSWVTKDADSGVDHVDARFKVKRIGGTWSRWRYPDRWQGRTANASIQKHFKRHHRYTIQAKVTDRAGNTSGWAGVGGGGRR